MSTLQGLAAVAFLTFLLGSTPAGEELAYKTYANYFESNRSGLTGPESFVVIGDRKRFDETFGLAVVMGRTRDALSADAFDTHIVLAAIHRGRMVWIYKTKGATAKGGELTLRYAAEAKDGGSATYASPFIVSVPKGDYKSAVFVENGKPVATVPIAK